MLKELQLINVMLSTCVHLWMGLLQSLFIMFTSATVSECELLQIIHQIGWKVQDILNSELDNNVPLKASKNIHALR